MSIEQVSLFFQAGSSDKEYRASIEAAKGGYIVNFAFGRRGSTLTTGTKTGKPVSREKAKEIFDQLIREKTKKGYKPGDSGSSYSHTDQDQRQTDILPQLLNEIDEERVYDLIADEAWCAQEKHDGRRVLVRSDADGIIGVNRSGLTIALPSRITVALQALAQTPGSPHHFKLMPHRFILDGECVGDVLYAFDMLSHDDVDEKLCGFSDRYTMLRAVLQGVDPAVQISPLARSYAEKKALFDRLRVEKREGIVFKRKSAPYTVGRPNSGGDQLKFKFTATATCLVTQRNGSKRSVGLRLFENGMGTGVDVGNVTIPTNHAIPAKGMIIEIRYLYAYRGGSLYQPVYLGPRDDVDVSACTLSQLKYKPDSADSDGEES